MAIGEPRVWSRAPITAHETQTSAKHLQEPCKRLAGPKHWKPSRDGGHMQRNTDSTCQEDVFSKSAERSVMVTDRETSRTVVCQARAGVSSGRVASLPSASGCAEGRAGTYGYVPRVGVAQA